MIDLNKMAEKAYLTAQKRKKNGENIPTDIISVLKHCSTEVVESALAYASPYFDINEFNFELADIITCVLIIAGMEKIDIENALLDVQEQNRKARG